MASNRGTIGVNSSMDTRLFGCMVSIFGLFHYGVGCFIWISWIRGFGIDRFNYGYYLRDALPAFVFLLLYFWLFVHFAKTKRPAIVVVVLPVLATMIHFAIDERFHHFTVHWLTEDRGCIWLSPTWWWYQHRCGWLSSG